MLLLKVLKKILNHPLNKNHKLGALGRFFKWQLSSRLLPYPILFQFMEHSQLIIRRGMTGATGNLYCGLDEFEDMGFLLHYLKKEDLFVDIGANIGSYTVLAGSEVGCDVISIEPNPQTFNRMEDNIFINRIESKVKRLNIGLGSKEGNVDFSDGLDTVNHVLAPGEKVKTISIKISSLDTVLKDKSPALIKVDVEGYEQEVFLGAKESLSIPTLNAIIVELVGHGNRYGFNDDKVHDLLIEKGFKPYSYNPFNRTLVIVEGRSTQNTIYIRDIEAVRSRINSAKLYYVNGNKF